jgi:hypothetical protein
MSENRPQCVDALEIALRMKSQGLPDQCILQAVGLSDEFDGILNLMRMLRAETELCEREAIVADIQELIDDCSRVDASTPALVMRARKLCAFLDDWEAEHGLFSSDELRKAAEDLKQR